MEYIVHRYVLIENYVLLNPYSLLFKTIYIILMINKLIKCTEKDANIKCETKHMASRASSIGNFGFKLVKKINRKEYSADILEDYPIQIYKWSLNTPLTYYKD